MAVIAWFSNAVALGLLASFMPVESGGDRVFVVVFTIGSSASALNAWRAWAADKGQD